VYFGPATRAKLHGDNLQRLDPTSQFSHNRHAPPNRCRSGVKIFLSETSILWLNRRRRRITAARIAGTMRLIILASLAFALPVAVVAFYLGNFAILMALSGYVTIASVALFVGVLRGIGTGAALERG